MMPALAPPSRTPLLRQIAPTDSSGRLSGSILDSSSESNYDDLVGLSDSDTGAYLQRANFGQRMEHGSGSGSGQEGNLPSPGAAVALRQQQHAVSVRSFTKQLASASKARVVKAEEVRIRGTSSKKRSSSSSRHAAAAAANGTANSSAEDSPNPGDSPSPDTSRFGNGDTTYDMTAATTVADSSFHIARDLGVQSSRLLSITPPKVGSTSNIVQANVNSELSETAAGTKASTSHAPAKVRPPLTVLADVRKAGLGSGSRSNTQDSEASSVALLAYDPRPSAERSSSLDVPSNHAAGANGRRGRSGSSSSTNSDGTKKGRSSPGSRPPPSKSSSAANALSPIPPTPSEYQASDGAASGNDDEEDTSTFTPKNATFPSLTLAGDPSRARTTPTKGHGRKPSSSSSSSDRRSARRRANSTASNGDNVGVWGENSVGVPKRKGDDVEYLPLLPVLPGTSVVKEITPEGEPAIKNSKPPRKNSANARMGALAAGAMKGLGLLAPSPSNLSPIPAIKAKSGTQIMDDDQLSPPPLGASVKGADATAGKDGKDPSSISFWSQQQRALQDASSADNKSRPHSPLTPNTAGATPSGLPAFSSSTRRAPHSNKMLGRDEMLGRLLAEQARVDAENYSIMTLERVQEIKQDITRLEKRMAEVKKKLGVETRLRDAAIALRKSHKRNPSSANAPSATTPTSPDFPASTSIPKKLSPATPKSPASPSRTTKAAGSPNDSKIDESISTSSENVERIAQQLISLSERAGALRKSLLEHDAAVLAQRLEHMEEEQESTLVDSDAASAGAPEPLPTPRLDQRHSLDLALRKAQERAEAVEQELEEEKQKSTRLQLQMEESNSQKQVREMQVPGEQESMPLQSKFEQAQLMQSQHQVITKSLHAASLTAQNPLLKTTNTHEEELEHSTQMSRGLTGQTTGLLENTSSRGVPFTPSLFAAPDHDSEVEALKRQIEASHSQLGAAESAKAALTARLTAAEQAAAAAEDRAFQAEAASELERTNAEEAGKALRAERSHLEETLRALQKEQLRADTSEHTLDELRQTHEELSRAHTGLRSQNIGHSATIETWKARAEAAEKALGDADEQSNSIIEKEKDLLEVKEAMRKAERLAALQTEGIKGEQTMHAVTRAKLDEQAALAKEHLKRVERAESEQAAQQERAAKAEQNHAAQLIAATEASAKLAAETKRANSAEQQLQQIELAVTAERRIMADRDNVFLAFEQRLESAESRLREQDKRCAQLLGKLDGREEMDTLLEQIKLGSTGRKERSTAGQNIDSLITSVAEHITDLVDEVERLNGSRTGGATLEDGSLSAFTSRSLNTSSDMAQKAEELMRAAKESQERAVEESSSAQQVRSQLEKLQSEFKNLQDIEIEVRNELVNAREELSERDARLQQLELAMSQASLHAQAQESVAELKEEVDKLKHINEGHVAKEKAQMMQIAGLQEDLAASKAFVSEMQKRQSQASPRVISMPENRKTLSDLSEKLVNSQKEAGQAQQRIAELKGELAGLRAQAERFASERLETQKILESAREELAQAKSAGTSDLAAQRLILELRTRCSQLTSEFANAQVALDAAKQELATEKAALAAMKSSVPAAPTMSGTIESPVGNSLQQIASLFPDAVQASNTLQTKLTPTRSINPAAAGNTLKKLGGLAELRARFEQPASSTLSTSPSKDNGAVNQRSPSPEPSSVSICLDWAKVSAEVQGLKSSLSVLQSRAQEWDSERQRLLAQVEAMRQARDSAQELLAHAQQTYALEIKSAAPDRENMDSQVEELQSELAKAQETLKQAQVSLQEAISAKEQAQQAALSAQAVPAAQASMSTHDGSAASVFEAPKAADDSLQTPPRAPPTLKSLQLQPTPVAAKVNSSSPASPQFLELPTTPNSLLVPLPKSPGSPSKALPVLPLGKGLPHMRTMTLGMDPAQLSARVRQLEDELRRTAGGPRRLSDASSYNRMSELEAEVEEVKDELLAAREELDELKAVQTKQRIQLLDEMNTLQEELASVRAKLRFEQRRRARDAAEAPMSSKDGPSAQSSEPTPAVPSKPAKHIPV